MCRILSNALGSAVSEDSPAAVNKVEEIAVKRPARPKRKSKPKRQPRYSVILWDDQDHTPQYVIGMMRKLFGHPTEKGVQIADEVNNRGKAIVLTTTLEHAELKRDQIHAYGPDKMIARCKGSMSSTIEAEPSS